MTRIPLLMVITSVLAGLGIIQLTFLVGDGVYRSLNWSAESHQLRAENERLREDIEILRGVRDRAVSGEYLLELARCQGFVGAAERVVVDQAKVVKNPAAQTAVTTQGNCDPVPLP